MKVGDYVKLRNGEVAQIAHGGKLCLTNGKTVEISEIVKVITQDIVMTYFHCGKCDWKPTPGCIILMGVDNIHHCPKCNNILNIKVKPE